MGRFEQRFRIEHELRISLRVEYCAREHRYAARRSWQRMHDHLAGVDHPVHPNREQLRTGLNNCRQMRTRIGAGRKRPPHYFGQPDKWNRATFKEQ